MKQVIGVSQLEVFVPGRDETRDCVDQRLLRYVREADMMPIQIPNVFGSSRNKDLANCELIEWLEGLSVAGIILSGGADIGSSPNRDITETCLLDWSIENKIPVLGICRGMQVMACHFGAELKKVAGHAGTYHVISDTQTLRKRLVNSFHNLSIKELPRDFFVEAVDEDGLIEQISHSVLPWIGVMWHPERERTITEEDQRLIVELFHGR